MVECPDHGTLEAQTIWMSGLTLRIEPGNYHPCPICRKPAYIVPGNYVMEDMKGVPTVFTPSNRERVQLQRILDHAQEDLISGVSVETVVRELESGIGRVNPQVLSMADRARSTFIGQESLALAAWLAVLLAILQLLLGGGGVSEGDVNRIVLEQCAPAPEVPAPPTPSEPPHQPAPASESSAG